MSKPEERAAARSLRAGGASIKDIARRLSVSPSSVSLWVRDIELAPEHLAALAARNPIFNAQRRGQQRTRERARDRRRTEQEAGRRAAAAGDPLHAAGCMLFWAEGSRRRNSTIVTNSDPELLRFFVRFLTECLGVDRHRLTLSVNCHLNNGLTLEEIEAWWCDRLDLPPSALRAASIGRASNASKRRSARLVYGTAQLCLHDTAVTQHLYGAIQAYAGFERPSWLDGRRPKLAGPP